VERLIVVRQFAAKEADVITRRSLTTFAFGIATLAGLVPANGQERKPHVVASFSILGDLVRQVGGDRVEVIALVGPNGDAHVYQPSPADASRLVQAKLIVVNGLGLETWMDRLIRASGSKASVVTASKGIKPLKAEADEHSHGAGVHHTRAFDPHAWQNVANVKVYITNIRDALVQADPDGKATYEANAKSYGAKLDQLESEVKAAIANIPAGKRKIITTHDAFGYFAKAYGMQFIAPQGVSTDAEASAKGVAKIVRQIRTHKIPAVFLENVSDPRLMLQIARESGGKIGDKVYSDALSEPDGPAATYIDMMRHNIRAFSQALTS
jgi:zinc/manganese transport system substrate-binding protein